MINDERMLPCYDVLSTMCDNMFERVPMLVKMGREIPSDMLITLHTLLYASSRAGVDELVSIGGTIASLCGKKFVAQTEKDDKCVHEVVRENINIITPEEGWKVERLMEIAREVNLPYSPSERYLPNYKKYVSKKKEMSGSVSEPFTKSPAPGGLPDQSPVPNTMGSSMSSIIPQPVVPPGPYGNLNTKLVANLGSLSYPRPTSSYPPSNPGYHHMPPGGGNFQQPSGPQYPPMNFNHPPPRFDMNPGGIPKQDYPPFYGYQQPPTTMPNCTSRVLDPNQLPPHSGPSPPRPSGSIDLSYPTVGPMPDSVVGGPPAYPNFGPSLEPKPDPKFSEIDDFELRLANLKNN